VQIPVTKAKLDENDAGPRSVRPGLTAYWLWSVSGLALLGAHVALARISAEFAFDGPLEDKPVLALVGLEVVASGIFLLVVWKVWKGPRMKGLLTWIIVVGVALRVCMMFSTPMLEDDYYRYMWDGAVLANGMNPYRHSPGSIADDSGGIPDRLRALAQEGKGVLENVNHPHLRTIYPPLAQIVFAAAYFLKPWSVLALRLLFLMFDVATLLLLVTALRSLDRSTLWIVIYWWNPLVVKEIFNSVHMDVIALPFAVGAILLACRERYRSAVVSLALAAGAKLWPVVLLPVVLSPLLRSPRRLVSCAALFGLILAAMLLPIFVSGLGEGSGFAAYGRHWEMNDALYMLFLWGVRFILGAIQIDPGMAQIFTRVLVTGILLAWIAWVSRRMTADPAVLWERSLLIVAAVFLLSPTQFPWYYVWVTPFLVIRPRASLLVLNALLFLYYLRFYFDPRNHAGYFDNGIVWLEFVPVWFLIILEWGRGLRCGNCRRTLQGNYSERH